MYLSFRTACFFRNTPRCRVDSANSEIPRGPRFSSHANFWIERLILTVISCSPLLAKQQRPTKPAAATSSTSSPRPGQNPPPEQVKKCIQNWKRTTTTMTQRTAPVRCHLRPFFVAFLCFFLSFLCSHITCSFPDSPHFSFCLFSLIVACFFYFFLSLLRYFFFLFFVSVLFRSLAFVCTCVYRTNDAHDKRRVLASECSQELTAKPCTYRIDASSVSLNMLPDCSFFLSFFGNNLCVCVVCACNMLFCYDVALRCKDMIRHRHDTTQHDI